MFYSVRKYGPAGGMTIPPTEKTWLRVLGTMDDYQVRILAMAGPRRKCSPDERDRIRFASALQPDGTFLKLRVSYPRDFFSRGMDGRIDDARAGWKGRAIYADYGPNAVWHIEGSLGTKSAVAKFQLRPDPLAH